MNKLQTESFTVIMLPPITVNQPVDGRKYTLNWKKDEYPAILTIGTRYHSLSHVNKSDEQLRLEWKRKMGEYILSGKVYFDLNDLTEDHAKMIMDRWIKEIPSMLSFIVQSDYALFQHAPWLLNATIIIEFESKFEKVCMKFGTPRKYLLQLERK